MESAAGQTDKVDNSAAPAAEAAEAEAGAGEEEAMAVDDQARLDSQQPLSEREAAVYDRQIRVWGFEAQKRLRGARLLVIGCTGVVAEACKNVVLAGLGSVTLLDDTPVSPEVAAANLLVPGGGVVIDGGFDPPPSMAQTCGPNLQELNPMVKVTVEEGCLEEKGEDFLGKFDVVVLGRTSLEVQKKVNAACRRQKKGGSRVAFYSVDCRGMCGRIFADLQTHQFTAKGREADGLLTEKFVSLEDALSIPWKCYPKRTHKLLYALQVIEEFERRHDLQPGSITSKDLEAICSLREEMAAAQGMPPDTIDVSILERIVADGRSEMPAVCAILGGILGQELLRCVSAKGLPINNFFFYDAVLGDGVIERLLPEEACANK